MNGKSSSIIDYVFLLARWKKLVILNFLIFTVFTAAVSLIMRKTFTAVAVILPPVSDVDDFGLGSLVGNLPFGINLGGTSTETNIFLAILNSRSVKESIAVQFNLQEVYETDNMEETLRALTAHVGNAINDDGTIQIWAQAETDLLANSDKDKDPARHLARDIANAFIEKLDEFNKGFKTERAHNSRLFVEKRYNQNVVDLALAEENLKSFQEQHNIIALPEQTQAAIEVAAMLMGEITAKEIEVEVLKQYISGSHNQLTRAEAELRELRKQLLVMKVGKPENLDVGTNGGDVSTELFLPLQNTPELGMQYVRLFREVTIQQKIQEFILPQYEQAKIREAKDTPTVQVLDPAIVPIKRSSPKRALMVLTSGFLSLILSVLLILIFEYYYRIREEGGSEYEKLSSAMLLLRGGSPPKRL